MEGKGSFLVLLIIVAFLSLTLAVLAGYVFFVGGGTPRTTVVQTDTKKPDEKDLVSKVVFEKENFNLKNEDEKKISMAQATVVIQYSKKIKNVEEKLTTYDYQIKEIIRRYFKTVTKTDLEDTKNEDKAKEVLCKQINELLTASEKGKDPIVFDVIFSKLLYQ